VFVCAELGVGLSGWMQGDAQLVDQGLCVVASVCREYFHVGMSEATTWSLVSAATGHGGHVLAMSVPERLDASCLLTNRGSSIRILAVLIWQRYNPLSHGSSRRVPQRSP